MDPTPISISARTCSEAETQAVSLWSASFLPLCRHWASRRGLHPPAAVLETAQHLRFAALPLSATALEPLVTASPNTGQAISNGELDPQLEELAAGLSRDLCRYQAAAVDLHEPVPRDVERFQRAMSQWHLTHIQLVASEPMIAPLFSLPKATLYLPRWLVTARSHRMFEPNQAFYRARPASLAWMLLDALVVINAHEFRWFDVLPRPAINPA